MSVGSINTGSEAVEMVKDSVISSPVKPGQPVDVVSADGSLRFEGNVRMIRAAASETWDGNYEGPLYRNDYVVLDGTIHWYPMPELVGDESSVVKFTVRDSVEVLNVGGERIAEKSYSDTLASFCFKLSEEGGVSMTVEPPKPSVNVSEASSDEIHAHALASGIGYRRYFSSEDGELSFVGTGDLNAEGRVVGRFRNHKRLRGDLLYREGGEVVREEVRGAFEFVEDKGVRTGIINGARHAIRLVYDEGGQRQTFSVVPLEKVDSEVPENVPECAEDEILREINFGRKFDLKSADGKLSLSGVVSCYEDDDDKGSIVFDCEFSYEEDGEVHITDAFDSIYFNYGFNDTGSFCDIEFVAPDTPYVLRLIRDRKDGLQIKVEKCVPRTLRWGEEAEACDNGFRRERVDVDFDDHGY